MGTDLKKLHIIIVPGGEKMNNGVGTIFEDK